MADQDSTVTSYTVLSGGSLLLPKPDGEVAVWTPVQLVENKVIPEAAGSRVFAKLNDQPGFTSGGQAGTRKLRIAIGGSQADPDHNTFLVQLVSPPSSFDPNDLSSSLPVPTITVSAESQGTTPADETADEDALVAANVMAGLGCSVMLRDGQADGSMTAVVRIGSNRPAHSIVVIDLDFGYSASN